MMITFNIHLFMIFVLTLFSPYPSVSFSTFVAMFFPNVSAVALQPSGKYMAINVEKDALGKGENKADINRRESPFKVIFVLIYQIYKHIQTFTPELLKRVESCLHPSQLCPNYSSCIRP